MNLPIDVINNSTPPRFRWRQVLETPIGTRILDHEGPLPPTVEMAVVGLIGIAKQLALDNEELKTRLSLLTPPPIHKIPNKKG